MATTYETRDGAIMPRLGMGTWYMGERPGAREGEIEALRLGLDLGLTLIDTAEMYGDGKSEALVGEAIRGRRDEVFLVTKVLPHNASATGAIEACERSLRLLGTDRVDLFLLHWQGPHPLEETFAAFERLKADGKILRYGVSNFDAEDMAEGEAVAGGAGIADQVLYSLASRGAERRLIPWCAERGIAVMAYSPFYHGRMDVAAALEEVAGRHGVTPHAVAIAWTLRHENVVCIPKAANPDHIRANAAALDLNLTGEDLAALDAAYPAPTRDVPLDIL
ncbi:MAG: aldo/keto reductase [Rhodospirillaceae bacterium]|jgi:diketogulonate reductase-like aldo/keto reductase|nr:aldo/keto reductase [Rhodospirillaceae bacterium]MBT6118823.1 aldo/keto reductase [Rhodospirillaceae bacterium]